MVVAPSKLLTSFPLLIEDVGGNSVVGSAEISGEKFFLDGHFDGDPIVPMSVLGGMMTQLCSHFNPELYPGFFLPNGLMVKSRKPVRPGDVLMLTADLEHRSIFGPGDEVILDCKVAVGSSIVANGKVRGIFTDRFPVQADSDLETEAGSSGHSYLNLDKICSILLHRRRMLLIHEIRKNFNGEPYALFQPNEEDWDRYVGGPTVLNLGALAEAMGQFGLVIWINDRWPGQSKMVRATSLSLISRRRILPGDDIVIKVARLIEPAPRKGVNFVKAIISAYVLDDEAVTMVCEGNAQ